MFINNNHALFHLWGEENLLKHRKVWKYYDHDCSLKLDIDKLNIENLKTFPIDLSKLINVVNNAVVKKSVYDELDKKANTVDLDKT